MTGALDGSARSRRALWSCAFGLAAALHLGAMGYATSKPAPQDLVSEDMGGMLVMEFAPLPVAPESEDPQDTASTEAPDASPAPMVEEKKSAAREDDLPTTEASPHEAPPDLQLAQHKTLKQEDKPEDGEPTEANEPNQTPAPSAAAPASAASAPPAALVDEASAAPSEGSTAKADDAPASWRRAVIAHLGKHKRYPAEARSRKQEGEAAVRFTMDRSGKVLKAAILRTSGSKALDAAALDLLDRAQPLPALPASMKSAQIELVAPVIYRLR
ncbi:MAG: putative Protein TonB [Hyphomicrobiales bacterium]|nr:putative Protein TonB [Hyphomicrobiales bacterium]